MARETPTLWLTPTGDGCGECAPGDAGPVCRHATLGAPCDRPAMHGDPALLARLMDALRDVGALGENLVDARRIRALRVDDGEAELTLTFPRGCGPARLLAESAFEVLRRELPDTDVYVMHAPG